VEEYIREDHRELTVRNGKSDSMGLRPNLGGVDSDVVQGNLGLRIPNMMFPAPMKTTLKLSVPPTWVVLFQRISTPFVGSPRKTPTCPSGPAWMDRWRVSWTRNQTSSQIRACLSLSGARILSALAGAWRGSSPESLRTCVCSTWGCTTGERWQVLTLT